jgi:hypothetical protein
METLIDQIRAALADGASDETKQLGAAACRSALAAIEPTSATAPTPAAPAPMHSLGAMPALAALRAPREQVLDHVIARLRALQPDAAGAVGIATALGALRTLSLDQVLDLGLAKLRTALAPTLPEGTRVIHLAPAPPRRPVPR